MILPGAVPLKLAKSVSRRSVVLTPPHPPRISLPIFRLSPSTILIWDYLHLQIDIDGLSETSRELDNLRPLLIKYIHDGTYEPET
jgi:hypothetical protein